MITTKHLFIKILIWIFTLTLFLAALIRTENWDKGKAKRIF